MSSMADKMVYNLRGLANSKPSNVFVATDIKNAFGTVQRTFALRALLKHLPFLAPIMSLLCGADYNTFLVPHDLNNFGELLVMEGVFQGEFLSIAVFCIFLRFVVDAFYTKLAVAMRGKVLDGTDIRSLIIILAHVDVLLRCSPDHLGIIWPLWIQVLRDHGLELEPKKCKAWIPENQHVDTSINKVIPVFISGLPVLGTAAQAKHSTPITDSSHPIPLAGLLANVTVRSNQANDVAELLIHMVGIVRWKPRIHPHLSH